MTTFCQFSGLDKKTHPISLLSLCHGQHDLTRLAINLCFLILRRKGEFKILEERQSYDLHLKNSENSANRQLVALRVRSGTTGTALTRIASRCTHECRTLKSSRIRRRQLGRGIRVRTEAHPVASHQSSPVEINLYSRVAKESDVGRRFLEMALRI